MTDVEAGQWWAIVELMGHRRLAGLVEDVEMFGARMLRLDVYAGGAPEAAATQFYAPAAVYCVTPCAEAVARALGARSAPRPVAAWELEAPRPSAAPPWTPDEGEDPGPDSDDPLDDLDEPEHAAPDVPPSYVPPRDDSHDTCSRAGCGHARHVHAGGGPCTDPDCGLDGGGLEAPPCPSFVEDIPF